MTSVGINILVKAREITDEIYIEWITKREEVDEKCFKDSYNAS